MIRSLKAVPRRNWLMLIPMCAAGLWFFLLEQIAPAPRYIIYSPLDDLIPFVSAFIIPYVIWYFYVAGVGLLLFLTDSDEFVRFAAFIAGGMLIACAIYTFFPNGQMLRPDLSSPQGPLEAITAFLYTIDTPTNSSPSIHVVYSVAAHVAVVRYSRKHGGPGLVRAASLILAVLIIMSTVFVKQHSVLCIVAGLLLSLVLYVAIYIRVKVASYRAQRGRKTAKAAY